MIRPALAWTLYCLGHAWYVVFDRWFPLGMRGLTYRVYNGLMGASGRAQGEGPGPWVNADHFLGEPYEPCIIHFDEAGYSEFVMADVPTVIRDLGDGTSLVLDARTRKPIGVRWNWRPWESS